MAGKFLFLICMVLGAKALVLEKVLIFSRHNIRTPLVSSLGKYTSKNLPHWSHKSGLLTDQGARNERKLGEYFSMWFKDEGFLSNECPDWDSVHVCANNLQRTEMTARVFADALFGNCSIDFDVKKPGAVDDRFRPVIRNSRASFRKTSLEQMQSKLRKAKLSHAYKKLNWILDIKSSWICRNQRMCDLSRMKDEIVFKIGKEPNLKGPLAIGNEIMDSFLMQYYSGVPMEEIAWGEWNMTTMSLLSQITRQNLMVRFTAQAVADDVARPLRQYIREAFTRNPKRKFTVMVGHDSNISAMLRSLRFESFRLKEQLEFTPIGGKVVFQKWYDERNNVSLLKVQYVYASMFQQRYGEDLTAQNPPMMATLALKECKVDESGFCLWDDFMRNVIDEILN